MEGEERWLHMMEVMQKQGFDENNDVDSKHAKGVLAAVGLNLEDSLQLSRLLRALHLYYIPNIPEQYCNKDSDMVKMVHKDTLDNILSCLLYTSPSPRD